ncbi:MULTISPECIES: hypothetical protein [Brevibacillus]|uniref:hypothetical protein n=1 Tax=Brevibacillus TaxID=55080 RepID=UPI00203EAAF1|nr:hypothetical protein [Brevibacillus sp. AY1]MCM3080251.1 hypothetical protein [Brevibacillus invocatus]MCM3430495.1 hypothetical protein [Brevibacillus invocatus]MDH4615848.1 hypothetical protein [Brevibacillus sp. AY1]
MTRCFLPILYAWFALLLAVHPAMAQGEANWDKQFQAQVQEWMNAIASRDPQFKEWQNARTEVQTLGANQHQWLVSIKQSGHQVGYMVIGETPEPKPQARFVLLEYGVGDYILFDDAFAPREVAAEPVYDGFASHWLIAQSAPTTQMVNAKTGEMYPTAFHANEPVMSKLSPDAVVHPGEQLTQTRILKPTSEDPFDQIGWMHQLYSNKRITWGQLWQQQAEQSRITFTVPLYHEQVLAPYVVGSLHLWNDQNPYVGVWDEGLRFVPFSYADQVGQFHVNETSSPAE